MFHVFKWIPAESNRPDAGEWKWIATATDEAWARLIVDTAARNGHAYEYLAW